MGDIGGGSLLDTWYPSQQQQCGQAVKVLPESSIKICNGLLTESLNDHGSRPVQAMYPKQPFDFAGRTGTVAFDVSNDSGGSHAAWPEFWITDQPVPAPNAPDTSEVVAPRNGIGLRMDRVCAGGSNYNWNCGCPRAPKGTVWNIDSAAITTAYVNEDIYDNTTGGPLLKRYDCALEATGPGKLNHIEVRVSQGEIDVYATDAGTSGPLHHLASITGIAVPLTRGLIWLEDVHYNGNKTCLENGICQGDHTFTWGSVAFDGPALPRDLAFDVNDSLTPMNGGVNLGWAVPAGGATSVSLQTLPIPSSAIAAASRGLLTFNVSLQWGPSMPDYRLNNGPWHAIAWPYPDTAASSWRTFAQPIDLAEVQPGANTISFRQPNGTTATVVANVDLILVGAGGVVAPS